MLSHVRLINLAVLTTCFCSISTAWVLTVPKYESGGQFLQDLEQAGHIYTDNRPAPPAPTATLYRRDGRAAAARSSSASDSTSSSGSTSTVTSVSVSGSSSSVASSGTASSAAGNSTTSTATSTSASYTYTASALPRPFDTSLSNNFTTTSCPTFMNAFLSNNTFQQCMPISLLLQNSLSFFQAVRVPSVLTETVNAACSAPLSTCSELMSNIASNLISNANCAQDFQKQNPLVTQAYAGLLAYTTVYNASCLKDSTTGQYCFVEAFTNANNNGADSYPYYLAVGLTLPTTAQPTCSTCLQKTMQIFAQDASIKGQPLTTTYLGAAQQIDGVCGPSFATTKVQIPTSNAGTASRISLVGQGLLVLASTTMVSMLAA